jgi:hypothetical protein
MITNWDGNSITIHNPLYESTDIYKQYNIAGLLESYEYLKSLEGYKFKYAFITNYNRQYYRILYKTTSYAMEKGKKNIEFGEWTIDKTEKDKCENLKINFTRIYGISSTEEAIHCLNGGK